MIKASPAILRHLSSASDVDANAGQELRLQCLATANPKPSYQWLRNNQILSLNVVQNSPTQTPQIVSDGITNPTNRIELHDQGRMLIVHNVQSSDAGHYTCVALNSVGEDKLNIDVRVFCKSF